MAFVTAQVEERFESPGPQPNGLQATKEGLWSIDQVDNKIYLQDWESGAVLFEALTDTVHSSGITLGDGSLWIASTYERKIARVDPGTGETLAKYASPGVGVVAWREGAPDAGPTGAHGLEWRDGLLYVASPPSQRVHVMDVASWDEVRSFPVPGLRVHGLAWGPDGRIWSADTSSGVVTLLDATTGRVHGVVRVVAPTEVHGLTIHEGVLWFCDAHTRQIGRLILEEE